MFPIVVSLVFELSNLSDSQILDIKNAMSNLGWEIQNVSNVWVKPINATELGKVEVDIAAMRTLVSGTELKVIGWYTLNEALPVEL